MKKILIVDDEKIVREGLKKIIVDHYSGCECITANDGMMAKEIIDKSLPDILITDIRMPRLGGMDLIDWISEKKYKIHCIILSGYDDNEYLHRAIKNRVDDYLLKPVKKADLYAALDGIFAKLEAESFNANRNIMADNVYKKMCENFCNSVLYDRNWCSEKQLCDFFAENYPDIDAMGDFRMLMVSNHVYNNKLITEKKDEELMRFGVRNIFDELLNDEGISFFSFFSKNDVIIYVIQEKGADIEKICEKICKKIYISIYQTISIGISSVFSTIENMSSARDEAENALNKRILKGAGVYTNIAEDGFKNDTAELNRIIDRLIKYTKIRDEDKIYEIVNEFENYVNNKSSFHAEMLFETLKYFIRQTTYFLDDNSINQEKLNKSLDVNFLCFDSIKQVSDWMRNVLKDILTELSYVNINKKLREVKSYIDEHYFEPISLDDMAKMIYVNSNYLSETFKKEFGISFVRYITNVRITHAIKLFYDHDLSLEEIAVMVGYNDIAYFSKIFKKEIGVSPSKYRKNMI